MVAFLFIFHRKNFRKLPGKLRKIFGKFRRKRKTTEIQLYLCGPRTGNIFRSMDSLVLRHPIICTEFNVRSFHSVQLKCKRVSHPLENPVRASAVTSIWRAGELSPWLAVIISHLPDRQCPTLFVARPNPKSVNRLVLLLWLLCTGLLLSPGAVSFSGFVTVPHQFTQLSSTPPWAAKRALASFLLFSQSLERDYREYQEHCGMGPHFVFFSSYHFHSFCQALDYS